jgi:hypothetical protein
MCIALELAASIGAALKIIDEAIRDDGLHWVVGGSCGLLLQRVALAAPPRDLDIYMDEAEMGRFHEKLAPYAIDGPALSETDRYRSILSHYDIAGVRVEAVGSFTVRCGLSVYRTEIRNVLLPYAPAAAAGGARIALMPLVHELVFNLLRGRPDRYEAIGEAMRRDVSAHLPLINRVLSHNSLDTPIVAEIARLLGAPIRGNR